MATPLSNRSLMSFVRPNRGESFLSGSLERRFFNAFVRENGLTPKIFSQIDSSQKHLRDADAVRRRYAIRIRPTFELQKRVLHARVDTYVAFTLSMPFLWMKK